MPDRSSSPLRAVAWPAYLAALLLVAFPLADLITNAWPVQPGSIQWRLRTLGILSGVFLTPVLGVLLAVGVASALGHRIVVRGMAVVTMIGAVVLAALVVLFGFDWLQMRPSLSHEARRNLDIGSLKALAKFGGVALFLGWIGVAGFRGSRRPRERAGKLIRPLASPAA